MRRVLGAVVLLAAVLATVPYGLAVSRYWNISPDSATLVGGALSLAAGDGYALLGRPIRLQPPVPSLVYAAALTLFPESYLALRVVTVVFLLLGLVLSFFLVRSEIGDVPSAAIMVACLASTLVFEESTRLLSEMFYLCFSMAALLAATRALDEVDRWRSAVVLGVALLLAVMTRTIGLGLPCAIMVCHALRVIGGRDRVRPRLMAAAAMALAAIVVWDMGSGRTTGLSYLTLLGQKQIWVADAGPASLVDVVIRMRDHLPELGRIGQVLGNEGLSFSAPLAATLVWVGTALFLLGLGVSCARGATPTNVYVVVYLLVVLAWGEVVSRFFVPIAPLLFLYAGIGLGALAAGLERRQARLVLGVVLGVWAVAYGRAGWREARFEIAEQHRSPFGDYPIKYRWNYDGERLALWLRDHTAKDVVYTSPFPDVYDLISERQSIPLPWTRDPAAFFAKLDEERVAYVLMSVKDAYVQEYVLPIVTSHPDRFVTVVAAPEATLYEYRGR